MTLVVLKAVFDPLCAYLDFLLFIDDISGSFQFQGFLTGLFSRRERERERDIEWHFMALASDSSNFEIILFFLIDTLELLLFEISFFHRIAK